MSELTPFTLDLDAHERTRLALVLEAIGDTYDPATVLADELGAHDLLYSDLDPQQQAVYEQLTAAGVLG